VVSTVAVGRCVAASAGCYCEVDFTPKRKLTRSLPGLVYLIFYSKPCSPRRSSTRRNTFPFCYSLNKLIKYFVRNLTATLRLSLNNPN
jgi:hypothetical protein